jgi:hypothetical protein
MRIELIVVPPTRFHTAAFFKARGCAVPYTCWAAYLNVTLCHCTTGDEVKRLSAVVSDEDYRRVEKLVKAGAAASIAQLVRDAVDEYVDKLDAGKLLNLRTVPLEQAREEVEKYLKDHPGLVWPDEMAEKLGLDYRIVLSVVQDLLREGIAEEVEAQVVEA